MIFLVLIFKMWTNYEELKDPESDATKKFGFYLEDVATDEVGKLVGIAGALLNQIRAFVMVSILVFASDYSWLQLILFVYTILIEGIFIFYSHPFGEKSDA